MARSEKPPILAPSRCRVRSVNDLLWDDETNVGAELLQLAQLFLREAHGGQDQPAGMVQGAGHDQEE